jgi:uncharacterized delta-60 repeat protein
VTPGAVVRRLIWLVPAGLAIAVTASGAPAAPASRGLHPDRSFGAGRGFVTTPIAGATALAYGALVLPGGDIVVAGQASPPSGNGQLVVARYLPNGRLDGRFGSRGIFESGFPAVDAPFVATAIARDPRTGKLLIGGGFGLGSMLVMRLAADGRLDPTFGSGRSGFAQVPVGGIANSLAIQRDGRILLGGSNANRNGRPFVVARFTPGGVLDRTFGRGGIVQSLFWAPSAASSAGVISLVPTADGGVLAAGHIDYIGGTGGGSGGHGAAGVFRLTRTGAPQKTFGTRGHTQITFFTGGVPQSWYPCGMAVDGRGRIVVTGGGGTHRFALFTARLTPRGTFDSTYGSARNGRTSTPGIGGNAITTCGLSISRAGQLTVGVQSKLAQLLPDGRPNTRFGRGGVFGIAAPKQVFVNALLSPAPGRVVVAGSAGNAIYAARYLVGNGR